MSNAIALLLIVVAGVVAGWLAGRVMTGYGFGLRGDAVVGVIGAFAGAYVFRATASELGGLGGITIVAFGGALLLLYIVRLFTGRRHGRRLWS